MAARPANPEAAPLLKDGAAAPAAPEVTVIVTTQPPSAASQPVQKKKDDPNKQGCFGRVWNFVSHRHSLITLFVSDFKPDWPRDAALWMFFFTIIVNIYFMLQYLTFWSVGGRIFLVIFCVLPTKCIAKWSVNKWGYGDARLDEHQKKTHARIIMSIWFVVFLGLSVWRLFEVGADWWGAAVYGFFITWGSTMVGELIQWWVVYMLLDTCCPCCVGCCLTAHEIDEAHDIKSHAPQTSTGAASPTVSVSVSSTGGGSGGSAGGSQ